jgi:hypothetical protein
LPNWEEIRKTRLEKGLKKRQLFRLLNPPKFDWESPYENPNKRRKLTPESVSEIRRRYGLGETCTALGIEFGIHSSTVMQVVHFMIWKRGAPSPKSDP